MTTAAPRMTKQQLLAENAQLRDACEALRRIIAALTAQLSAKPVPAEKPSFSAIITADPAKPLPLARYRYIIAQVKAGNNVPAHVAINQIKHAFGVPAALALRTQLRRAAA